jgi:uncharacterized membrane protein YagU involved in acid resistance
MIFASAIGVGVMCICWSILVLLPCIGKMKPTYNLGEGPTSMEMAGCISWVKYTIEVASRMISPYTVCNSCGTCAL